MLILNCFSNLERVWYTTCGYMSECDLFHVQSVITIFFGYTCIKTYQTCHKKSLLPDAMVPVLLKGLRSDVPRGLHAKNTHGNLGVCRHTHIHVYITWDTAHKNAPSVYLRVSNAPSFDKEL